MLMAKKLACILLLPALLLQLQVAAQRQAAVRPERLYIYVELAGQHAGRRQHQQALAYLDSALALAPDFAPFRYARAQQLMLAGQHPQALAVLKLLIERRQQHVKIALKDTVFNSHTDFRAMQDQLAALDQPIIGSAAKFVELQEKDLVPEGVAYDPVDKALYVSSIYKRKILKIRPDKSVTAFASTGQDGLLGVLGMEVDAKRRHLWVCSAYDPANSILHGQGLRPQAAIHKMDLQSGKLLQKYTLDDTLTHFFNDLTVLPNGDVYFTDSHVGTVYRIKANRKRIKALFSEPFLHGANGITKDSQGEYLYIASWLRGIIRYDVKSRKWKWLESDDPLAVRSGVDGLAYYKGSLIVNSPLEIGGLIRLRLNQQGDRIQQSELLVYRHPLFGEPTTGEVAGDSFYFIANAGLSAYDRNTGKLDKTRLSPPTILKINLTP